MEKQSVARRREPSWRVAATNGLMNLMEAPRYRVAGEPRWRITEAKEGKKERTGVERERRCESTTSSSTTTFSTLLILPGAGEHQKQRTKKDGKEEHQWKYGAGKDGGKKIVGFPDRRGCDAGGGALTERSIRKAEDGLPLGFSQLSKE